MNEFEVELEALGAVEGEIGTGTEYYKGDDGRGITNAYVNDSYQLHLEYTDGTEYTSQSIRGATGGRGLKGDRGISIQAGNIIQNTTIGVIENIRGTTLVPYLNDLYLNTETYCLHKCVYVEGAALSGNWQCIAYLRTETAYESAVRGGYVGSLEDFYTDLSRVDKVLPLQLTVTELAEKVDNIHGFDIVPLGDGEYNPETLVPIIDNPQENTLYLVPNSDESELNLWVEWLYINNRFEKFGSATVNLDGYVKNTDYATDLLAGVVRIEDGSYGLTMEEDGLLSLAFAAVSEIKQHKNWKPITTSDFDKALYYNLARMAGSEGNNYPNFSDANKTAICNYIGASQQTLTAGSGIKIENGVISCTYENGNEVKY